MAPAGDSCGVHTPLRGNPSEPDEIQVYDQFMADVALDEERILANLAFEPVMSGKQLSDKHFGVADFQGLEANRILLGCMQACIAAEEILNLPNLLKRLQDEQKAGRTKLELVGRDRVQKLFTNPFALPGVSSLEDLEPVIDRIRDRNLRLQTRRKLIDFAERLNRPGTDSFEVLGGCIQELRAIFLQGSAGYIRDLDYHLTEMRELIQDQKERKRTYIGYESSFPLLQERINGIQKEFYLIAGGVGMGKSTFVAQLAWDLAILNPDLTVLFISLDLNRLDITAKLVAQSMEVPIDYVKNPYVTNVNFERHRQEGIDRVGQMRDRLYVVDESGGRIFLEDIKKLIKRIKLDRGGEVAVVIDPIFKIGIKQPGLSFHEKCNLLATELKTLSMVEGVPVIATAGLPKAISNRRPVREDLEEIMGLLYEPYVIFFMYCDYLNDFETPFLEWEWGKDNFMIPITEVMVAKNKMGTINSRIFYRYYESYAKFKECAPQEVENYTAMIENLEKYKEHRKNLESRRSASHHREEEL